LIGPRHRSSPGPPSMWSLPCCPSRRSSPLPPTRPSSPGLAQTLSFPRWPLMKSEGLSRDATEMSGPGPMKYEPGSPGSWPQSPDRDRRRTRSANQAGSLPARRIGRTASRLRPRRTAELSGARDRCQPGARVCPALHRTAAAEVHRGPRRPGSYHPGTPWRLRLGAAPPCRGLPSHALHEPLRPARGHVPPRIGSQPPGHGRPPPPRAAPVVLTRDVDRPPSRPETGRGRLRPTPWRRAGPPRPTLCRPQLTPWLRSGLLARPGAPLAHQPKLPKPQRWRFPRQPAVPCPS